MRLPFLDRKAVIGIDIGSHSIKMVEMRIEKDKPAITGAGYVRMDLSLEREGEIQRRLKELLSLVKPSTTRCIADISSSDEMVIMRTMFIPEVSPDMSDEEMIETTRSEVEEQDYLPYPIEKALVSSDLLGRVTSEGEKGVEVFFVAVHKGLPEGRARMMRKLGLRVLAIDVDVLALARLIGMTGIASDKENVAVVDVGDSKTSLFFYLKGRPIFYPHIPIGGRELTEEISRRLDVKWEEAERLKKELKDERVRETLISALMRNQGLIQSLKSRFEYHMADYPPPERVILTGGTSQLPFMEGLLSSELSLPVERIKYMDRLDPGRRVEELKVLTDNQALFAIAAGLALKVMAR